MNKLKTIVDWCIASMETEPEAWTVDHYTAEHASGVTIWIANSHYGLAIYADRRRTDTTEVGGLNGWSSFFGVLAPWRRKLLAAARRLERRKRGYDEAADAIIAAIDRATLAEMEPQA